MAFQDFANLSLKRRAEKEQKLRKRIIIGVVVAIALLLIIAGAVYVIIRKTNDHSRKNKPALQQPTGAQAARSEEAIRMICNATDYKEACEKTLSKVATSTSVSAQPRDVMKVAIKATGKEIVKAYNETNTFKFETPEEKAAFEDCKELVQTAIDELKQSVLSVDTSKAKASDLNNWLSAVMSYTQTCIDGFPEGSSFKSQMQNALQAAKELTSNSLAIVSEVASILSSNQQTGTSRRLLAEDGTPEWMSHDERRMLKQDAKMMTPNVTVAKDGQGNFTTISAALGAMPQKYEGRYVIYVKEGVYDETVTVTKKMVNVTMYGDGSRKSVVTGSKNFKDGVRTFQTASFAAIGDGFMAMAMGFRNTAGPEKHQAVALRVQSDRSIFVNCRFEGYQDTLYTQTHRQYYRSCVVSGTVDFIFGDAAVIFQNCQIMVRKPMDNQQNIITAQGRTDRHETTGIVLQNCSILADEALVPVKANFKSYLGRPWKEFSRTIIMESTIDDHIHPDGYLPWDKDFALSTLYYAEYNNKGPGAETKDRVKWAGYKGIIDKQEAMKYTVGPFLQGQWIREAGAPVRFGLYN